MRQSVEVGATPFILALLTDPDFLAARGQAADAERAEDTPAWNVAKRRQIVVWKRLWEVVKPQPLR
jgi:hypothetical protein